MFLNQKRTRGQYFTQENPFNHPAFSSWAKQADLPNLNILEPFAGENNLIKMLQELNKCKKFTSLDINPQDESVKYQDTLRSFPKGFKVCITNPPYLAQNSAKRRGLPYPNSKFDDLYKFALDKCLSNCDYVGAILPASFLKANLFRDRLSCYISLNRKMFHDTDHPVCLSLFSKKSKDVEIYDDENYLGSLSQLSVILPSRKSDLSIKFNDPNGQLGLIAIDSTIGPSIRFCDGDEIDSSKVVFSSRSMTRISIKTSFVIENLIKNLNDKLSFLRNKTKDVFLTPFKGLRKDNKYRRRLDYNLARNLINGYFS